MSPPAEGGMDADIKVEPETKPALTPPSSEGTNKNIDDSGSELSDLEPEAPPEVPPPAAEAPKKDDSEIFPDHYYGGGNIPVFKPVGTLPCQPTSAGVCTMFADVLCRQWTSFAVSRISS